MSAMIAQETRRRRVAASRVRSRLHFANGRLTDMSGRGRGAREVEDGRGHTDSDATQKCLIRVGRQADSEIKKTFSPAADVERSRANKIKKIKQHHREQARQPRTTSRPRN